MKKIFLIAGCFIHSLFAQLQLSPSSQLFSPIICDQETTVTAWLVNQTDHPIHVHNVSNINEKMVVSFVEGQVEANDSIPVELILNPDQNIDEYDFLLVSTEDAGEFVFPVTVEGFFGDFYDSFTRNKWDINLYTALGNYVSGHTSLGYSTARDYMFTYVDNKNDSIECVYTGRKIYLNHNSTSPRSEAFSQDINTEHTFPQGFFDSDEPMRSDLFHLFPTDVDANSRRGSYPFGVVDHSIQWQSGGSKLGLDGNNQTVFEPRDVHKGNVARAMFYFVVRYENYADFLDYQEETLRQWNDADPVDDRELLRNDRIAELQGKRNPFIDHPQLAKRIISISAVYNREFYPDAHIFPASVTWFSSADTLTLMVMNQGRENLSISGVDIPGISSEVILPYTSLLQPGEMEEIRFMIPGTESFDSLRIEINTNDPLNPDIQATIINQSTLGVDAPLPITESFDVQLYPNPFNHQLNLSLKHVNSSPLELQVYNIMGQIIMDKKLQPDGQQVNIKLDFAKFSSGTYLIKVRQNQQFVTKKVLYLK